MRLAAAPHPCATSTLGWQASDLAPCSHLPAGATLVVMRLAPALVVLAACGRIGFDGSSGGGGGGGMTDAGGDAQAAGRWQEVATASIYACAIANDASLWCWGYTPYSSQISAPTAMPGSWTAVSGSNDHACAIDTAGALWCWGNNGYGELGDGTTNGSPTPVRVGTATWTAVSVGDEFTCGIQTGGALFCWGANNYGQLGNGTTTDYHAPKQVPGILNWTAISAGGGYACGVDASAALWCWGDNTYGELGDSTLTERDSPTSIAGGGMWTTVAVSSDSSHACGVRTDGTAWCWGQNELGQLGDGTANDSYVPVATGMSLRQVAVGGIHSCGIDATDGLWCWGDGHYGQLGAQAATLVPALVTNAHTVAASSDLTCVVDATGHLACTGRNSYGQLGSTPALPPGEMTAPTRVDTRTDWASITAGGSHACGMTSGGAALCWGLNNEGEVGDGTLWSRQDPVAMQNASGITRVIASAHSTFGLTGAGDSDLWGCDWVNQTNNSAPETMAMTGWTVETGGEEHTCGITGTALWCRGDDTYGQIGDGNTTGVPSNYQVAGTWTAVSAGYNTTCAIQSGGTVACWGDGGTGQLGNGMLGTFATPQTIAVGGTATQIRVGTGFACALVAPGKVSCWGDNSSGALGNGTTTDSSTFVAAGTRSDYVELAVGYDHACAITSGHTLWCWGHGGYGAVANPTLGDNTTPTQIDSATDWAHVAAGYEFTCALKLDGTRWCFGLDTEGMLGNGLAWHYGFVAIP
jgi:alpha-tubulin suppressor-like RCC1 family protein